ncbi:hypothetical protein Hypma_011289 [Hypsizygus marmoreus]|uniref:Uncharacterized protein n=1 Tax=Hypsizygus marmoreus TaxID=39966 RepID=A0A369JK87_HYPMA|nr:hypothetical protein Hypma_011289 [Hypsizygus marmoreus]
MSQIQNETSSANLQWLEVYAGTTNELLPDSARNLVRSLLRAALEDLEDLERQIAEADSMDSLLLKRVDDTSTRISRLRIAIAPHQTLPTEVLAEVFVNCIEDHSIRIPVPASQQIHWRLGHICSRWRSVALSETCLWNTIFFRYNPQKHTSIPPALQEALNRSAQGPLRLIIYCPPDAIGDPDIISDLIARYAHRCTDIQFSFPENKMKAFLANACTSFEALETASLAISKEHHNDIAHPFLQGARVFESAPRLRKLMLHGVWSPNNVALTLEDVNFPWRQLTHIELFTGSVVPSTAHALFIMCPNLQDCCFVSNVHGDGVFREMITASPSDITLPHLRHLHLGSPNPSFIFEIIRPLILPALTGVTQHFEIDISTRKQPFAALISLIRRSRCRLTKVEIVQKFMFGDLHPHYPDDMEALLELLPDVTTFWERGFVIPVSSLQRILAGELLNSVRSFQCSTNSIATCALFVDIVEARWTNEGNGGAILEEAFINNYVSAALQDDFFKEGARLHEIQERLKMKQRKINM